MKIRRTFKIRPVIGDGTRGRLCIKIGKEPEQIYPLSRAEMLSLLRDLEKLIERI